MNRSLLALAAILPIATIPVSAVDYVWNGDDGDGYSFIDPNNWGGGTPGAGDNVTINVDVEVEIRAGNQIDLGAGKFTLTTGTLNVKGGDTVWGMISSLGKIKMSGGTITSNGTTEATGRQHLGSTTGAGVVDLEMSGGVWSTAERLILGSALEAASAGSVYMANLSGSAQLSAADYFIIGAAGREARVSLSGDAKLIKGAANKLIVGDGGGSTGSLTLNDFAAVESAGEIDIGWSGSTGTLVLNQNAAVTTSGGKTIFIGRSSGTPDTVGKATLRGHSTMTSDGEIWVGNGAGSAATLNVYDNAVVTSTANNFHIGRDTSTGTINVGGEVLPNGTILEGEGKLIAKQNFRMAEHSGGNAYLNVNSRGRVEVTSYMGIGHAGYGEVNLTGDATLEVGGEVNLGRDGGTGKMVIKDRAVVTAGGWFAIGRYSKWNEGGYGLVEMHGDTASATGAVLNVGDSLSVGYWGDTMGRLIMDGKSTVNITGGALNVGASNGHGELTMADDARIYVAGGDVAGVVGHGKGVNALVTLSDNAEIDAGGMKWTSGDFGGDADASGSTIITLNDASKLTLREFTIGHIGGPTATETVTINDNATLTVNSRVIIGRNDQSTNNGMGAQLVLNGGTLAAASIQQGGTDSLPDATHNSIVANGGTIRALANETDFFKIATVKKDVEGVETDVALNTVRPYVQIASGGLTFDTQGFAVGAANDFKGAGDITKTGTGTLTLAGDNTGFTGAIHVSQGNIHLAGTAVLTILLDGSDLTNASNAYSFASGTGISFADGATLNIVLTNASGLVEGQSYTFNVFTGTTEIANTAGVLFTTTTANYQYTLNSNGTLVVQVVPEPSTYALFGAVALLGVVALRRKRMMSVTA